MRTVLLYKKFVIRDKNQLPHKVGHNDYRCDYTQYNHLCQIAHHFVLKTLGKRLVFYSYGSLK